MVVAVRVKAKSRNERHTAGVVGRRQHEDAAFLLSALALLQKVIGNWSVGFAAGCAAVAMPRRQWLIIPGLSPWFGLSPLKLMSQTRA
jgi:hypothetical protein